MKKFTVIPLVLALSGCLGEPKFDAENKETIKASVDKINQSLSVEDKEEFKKAIMYFSMGGKNGIRSMMKSAFKGNDLPDKDTLILNNLAALNDLEAQDILKKYRARLAEDKIEEEKEKARQAERDKVNALKKEADELLKNNKFEEAIAKFKSLSEIPYGVAAAEAGISKTNEALAKFTEKMDYIEQVEITEFVAERIDTYSKKDVPAVRISLKNNGDRSLDEVKVIVYFQDKDGNTIFEEDYYPVLASSWRDNKPLKSGYVKEMEKGKYYTLDSALSSWEEGKATAKIVDIEFSK